MGRLLEGQLHRSVGVGHMKIPLADVIGSRLMEITAKGPVASAPMAAGLSRCALAADGQQWTDGSNIHKCGALLATSLLLI